MSIRKLLNLPLKGMILAAGQGTRMRPLTKDIPKPMVPILGKPVMEYLVEHLARNGITEIMVNVSYLHRKISQYFGNGQRWGVSIGYSYEGEIKHGNLKPKAIGSAGGMRRIQDFGGFFDQTTLVICGDAIIDLDIQAAYLEHKSKKAMVSVVALEVPMAEVGNYGIIETNFEGRVISFQEKPKPKDAKSRLASTGIYFFEPEALALIPKGEAFDIGSQLFPLLVANGLPFFAQSRYYNWHDIGRIADYREVQQRALRGELHHTEMPGVEVKPGVWVGLNTDIDWDNVKIDGPVYIDSGVKIEAGAEIIGPSWISHGSFVHKNAKVIRSILFEYTAIHEGSSVINMVVAPNYLVNSSDEVFYIGDNKSGVSWGDARP